MLNTKANYIKVQNIKSINYWSKMGGKGIKLH